MKIIFIILFVVSINSQILNSVEKWSKPQEIENITKYFSDVVINTYINSSGDELYFQVRYKIYYIKKINDYWSAPIIINGLVSNMSESLPKISPNNKILYFVSDGQMYSLKRENPDQMWSGLKKVDLFHNGDRLSVQNYFFKNDTTMFIYNNKNIYKTTLNKETDIWNELILTTEFKPILSSYSSPESFYMHKNKMYLTYRFSFSSYYNGMHNSIIRDYLAVRLNSNSENYQNEYSLNLNDSLETLIGKNKTIFIYSFSLTEDGKKIFFSIEGQINKVFYSELVVDENGELVGINEDDKNSSIENSYLYQNYPNPFNPSTKIKYKVATDGDVIIKLYDLLGREKEVLINQYHKTGEYEINLNMQSYSSGVYFYSLKAGNYFKTNKLLLIK